MDHYTVGGNSIDDLFEFADDLMSGTNPHVYESWKPPSADVRTGFERWRNESSEIESKFRDEQTPYNVELRRVDKIINELFAALQRDQSKEDFTDAYYTLSQLLGKIDYLAMVKAENSDLGDLSNRALALYCCFTNQIVTPTNLMALGQRFHKKLTTRFYRAYLHYRELPNRLNRTLKNHIAINTLLRDYKSILPIL